MIASGFDMWKLFRDWLHTSIGACIRGLQPGALRLEELLHAMLLWIQRREQTLQFLNLLVLYERVITDQIG